MALLWEALATHEVKLLDHSMRTRFQLPSGCAWVNYLRSHDDIGWTFDNNDARWEWIDPVGHRQFLNQFYIGRFAGSFARGVPFQENPDTGDARVSGTLASLAGLEQALMSGEQKQVDLAVRRILMLHSIILSIGGIPNGSSEERRKRQKIGILPLLLLPPLSRLGRCAICEGW